MHVECADRHMVVVDHHQRADPVVFHQFQGLGGQRRHVFPGARRRLGLREVRGERRSERHQEDGGAALVLWTPAGRPSAPVQLHLERNTLQTGRVAALVGLNRGVDIVARGNRFAFRHGLLSYAGFSGKDGWRQASRWSGEKNQYESGGPWLSVDDVPLRVQGLSGWRNLWGVAEAGSQEKPLEQPAKTARRGGSY